jgi:hypothetical protein
MTDVIPSSRMAQVLKVPVLSAPGNGETMKIRTGSLGPKQLEWCRKNLEHFAICERQAQAAEEHRQQLVDAVRS